MDRRVASFAERHHGLVTRQLLLACGHGERAIEHMLESRKLDAMRPGVYRVVGTPASWMQGIAAVALSVEHSVITHATASAIFELGAPSGRYEITTLRDRRVRFVGVRAHRSLCWLPEDATTRAGLPVSSAARLVVDLSGRLTSLELGKMIDALARRRLLRIADLARTNGRLRAARGRRPAVVDQLLRARVNGYLPGDSDLEARIIGALQRGGLPAPTAQKRVRVGERRYRVDLCYPEVKLAIEIDSWSYHRWRSAFDGDRAKRNDLTLLGYRVLQVTDGMSDAEILGTVTANLAALGHFTPSEPGEVTQRAG